MTATTYRLVLIRLISFVSFLLASKKELREPEEERE